MKPDTPEGEKKISPQDGIALEYEEAVARHFEMQSASTKEMMLRTDKMRKRKNASMGREWYDQLFNNSCFKNSCMVKTGHMNMPITKKSSCFLKF